MSEGEEYKGTIPPNFQSAIKTLSGYAKQTVRCDPDRYTGVNAGDTIKVKLPPNALVDLRSFVMFFNGTATGVGSNTAKYQNRFFPRNSASIIDSLAVNINGQRIETIAEYNHLYNLLWDYSCSLENDNSGKRCLENTDPSVKSALTVSNGAITRVPTAAETTAAGGDVSRRFAITNWLGFLGSSSCEIIDTSILGDVEIEIRLAQPSILWKSCQPSTGAVAAPVATAYQLNDIYFTITRITFENNLFYEVQNSLLMSDGVPIAFKTFVAHRDRVSNKSINMNFAVNSQRLNKLICCPIPSDYTTENYLQLTGSDADATASSFMASLATDGDDLFNQSRYFKKDGVGILTSELKINNNAVSQAPLSPEEVFINNLDALNVVQDMNGGIHAGCYDINAFKKYYFCHIVPFEHRQSTTDFYLEGMDGRAAAINVKWTTTHDATNTQQVYPLVFSEQSKLLKVSPGQYIQLAY